MNQDSDSKQSDFSFPGLPCDLKMQRHRGYWRLPQQKSLPSRESWLEVSLRRKCHGVGSCAALSPSPTKTDRLGDPPESPSTCATPPRHACGRLWAGGMDEVRRESPTQRRLVPLRSGPRVAGHRTRARQGERPPARVPSPEIHITSPQPPQKGHPYSLV